MKELISICVSLFLVYTPIFAQSKCSVSPPSENVKDWTLILSNGAIRTYVQFRELRGDYLDISEIGIPGTIYIGSIDKISATKGERKTGMGAKIGFIIGALIPVTLAGVIVFDCIVDGCGGSDAFKIGIVITLASAAVLLGVIGKGIGAGIGSFFKYVEEYDMSGWSIEEKRVQIEEIMKKVH